MADREFPRPLGVPGDVPRVEGDPFTLIEVDAEVASTLRDLAQPGERTPNDVLRRVLREAGAQ